MAKSYSVTSAGISAAEDRAHRMRVYFIAMSLRVACVASLFFVRGWWVVLVAIGTIILPYYAVMIANAVRNDQGVSPEAPAPKALGPAPSDAADDAERSDPASRVIVVDSPAERRPSPVPETSGPEAS